MNRLWRNSSLWLLLVSLALNLLFVGVAVAIAVRAPSPPLQDRDVFVRVERLAATAPAGRRRFAAGADPELPRHHREYPDDLSCRPGRDPRNAAKEPVRRRSHARGDGQDPCCTAECRLGYPGGICCRRGTNVASRPTCASRPASGLINGSRAIFGRSGSFR
jgi:hypothetical protein